MTTRTISAPLSVDLSSKSATLAALVKFTRSNGDVAGFTTHDRDIVWDSVTYKASTGPSPTAIQTKSDLGVDTMEMSGFVSDDITFDAIRGGLWDNAAFVIYGVNWANPAAAVEIRRGWLGQSKIRPGFWSFELQGFTRRLNNRIGENTSPGCRNDLGDSTCQVNLAPYTISVLIQSVVNSRTYVLSDALGDPLANATGEFDQGKFTFTAGANNGLAFEIKNWDQSTGTIEFYLSVPFEVVPIDDTAQLHRGCHKRIVEDCKGVFDNVVHFRGEPHLPGNDRLQRYARLGVA